MKNAIRSIMAIFLTRQTLDPTTKNPWNQRQHQPRCKKLLSEKRENKKKPTFHPAALSTNPDHQLILSTPTAAAASRQFPRGDIIVAYSRWKLFESSCLERPSLTTQPPTHPSHPPYSPRSFVRSFVRSSVRRPLEPAAAASAATRSSKSPFSVPPPVASVRSPVPASPSPPLYRSLPRVTEKFCRRSLASSPGAKPLARVYLDWERGTTLAERARRRHSLCPVPENDDEAAAVESHGEVEYGEREAARVGWVEAHGRRGKVADAMEKRSAGRAVGERSLRDPWSGARERLSCLPWTRPTPRDVAGGAGCHWSSRLWLTSR